MKEIPFKPQRKGNCPWASSAAMGFRCVLACLAQKEDPHSGTGLTEFEITKEVADQFKDFHHFSKYMVVSKYIHRVKSQIDHQPIVPDSSNLHLISDRLINKILNGQDKKTSHPYYREALDEIVYSGIPVVADRLESIYHEDGNKLSEALSPQNYSPKGSSFFDS